MSTHAPSRRTAGEVARIPWEQLGSVRVGLVFWGGLALLDLGTLAHVPSYAELGAVALLVVAGAAELGAVALLVVAGAVGMRTATAVCAAGVGWLLVDGFVEHRYGVLGFDARTDLARLALLTGLALLATRVRR